MKYLIISIILLINTCCGSDMNSSCKIMSSSSGGSRSFGSGTVFHDDDDEYFIITNGHVVTRSERVDIFFFKNDEITEKIPAKLSGLNFSENTAVDMAIISVLKKDLDFKPVVIPLASRDTDIAIGDTIYCSGFPEGKWCQNWVGKIIGKTDEIIYFNAAPLDGQSGSCITKKINNEDRIIGITTWRFQGDGGEENGGGISLDKIYSIMDKKHNANMISINHKIIQHTEGPILIDGEMICNKCDNPAHQHYWVHNTDGSIRTKDNGKIYLSCQPSRCPRCGGYHIYNNQRPGGNTQPEAGSISDLFNGFNPESPESQENPDNETIEPPAEIPYERSDIEELKKRVVEYEAEIARLKKTIEELKTENELPPNSELEESLKNKIQILEKENASLLDQKESLSFQLQNITLSQKDFVEKNNKVIELNQRLSVSIEEYKLKVTELTREISELKTIQSNENVINVPNSQNSHEQKGSISPFTRFKNFASNSIKNLLIAKFGHLGAFLISFLFGGGIIGSFMYMILARKIGKKKAGIIFGILNKIKSWRNKGKTASKNKKLEYNTVEESPIVSASPQNNIESGESKKYSGAIVPNSRFRDLLDLKSKDGQKLYHWAALGRLYQEAVHLLRLNKLYYKPGQRIFGASEAAEQIISYVKNKLAIEISSESITLLKEEEATREALYGFLYKEAVEQLRTGKFTNLTNNMEIAEAIESHVNTRLLDYIEGIGKEI